MQIFVVIPVHNRKKFTRECLLGLGRQHDKDFKIIVVDDGSCDGTSAMVQNLFPEVTLLKGNGHLWWSGAMNTGVRYVLDNCLPNDCIISLNNDLIMSQNYISNYRRLAECFPHSLIGSVNASIRNKDTILDGGFIINWKTAKWKKLNKHRKFSSFPECYTVETSVLVGRGLLIPCEVFMKIGLFNNDHYPQCGDLEFTVRAKQSGYKLIVSHSVVIYSINDKNRNINSLEKYELNMLKDFFFNIKSDFNLRYRFWFAYDCTSNIFSGTIFFICDFIRIFGHFIRRLITKNKGFFCQK